MSIKNQVFESGPLPFTLADIEARIEPTRALMCSAEYFDIVDEKNVYMQGMVGLVDVVKAREQWQALHDIYAQLVKDQVIDELLVIPGQPDLQDMVFAANQTFPWNSNEKKEVVLSIMKHEKRAAEVPFFADFFKNVGYSLIELKRTTNFEGMGDTIPHCNRKLLYGGFGHRSSADAYDELSTVLKVPIVTLELKDERFYHLDTCFVPLDEDTVMLCQEAFSEESLLSIHQLFENVIDIPSEEAATTFSLNAHCITNTENGKKAAILQSGSFKTKRVLVENGFEVFETDTSEFMKSGGSVFCMKMMIY